MTSVYSEYHNEIYKYILWANGRTFKLVLQTI